MENSFFDIFKPLLMEAYRRRMLVITAFAAVSILAVVLGVNWPKVYESYSTISVQEKNILGRLVEGQAGAGAVDDRAQIARQTILGRSMMTRVLQETGKIDEAAGPKEIERQITILRSRTTITNVGTRRTNLIKIAYRSDDPQDAFETNQIMAQLFVAESSQEQERESQAAFQFIDAQVREYERKQKLSEEQLKEFRASNEAVTPGAEVEVRRRINRLRGEIAETEQALREMRIKENSLQNQLAGESTSAVTVSQAQKYIERRAELQRRLDALRLTYHDTYPDIVQLKSQIADVDKLIASYESRDLTAVSAGDGGASAVAQELKSELYDTRIEIRTLESRLSDTRTELQTAQLDAQAIPDAEARLAELTREYEVTKGIYEDLLRRREIARVSMNVDLEKQGFTLRIDEPAFYPYLPEGPRFWHFLLGGIVAGMVLPLALIFVLLQLRPKLRLLPHIPERTGLPVMGSIPHLATPREVKASHRRDIAAVSMVIVTFAIIAVISVMRYQGII